MKDEEKNINPESTEAASEPTTDANETTSTDIEAKYKEINDKFTRLYAEYDNFRKRTAREKIDWIKSAGEETIIKILPVLDDIERAITHNKTVNDPELLKEGMEL